MFYFNIDKMLRNGKFAYRAEEGGGGREQRIKKKLKT